MSDSACQLSAFLRDSLLGLKCLKLKQPSCLIAKDVPKKKLNVHFNQQLKLYLYSPHMIVRRIEICVLQASYEYLAVLTSELELNILSL